MYFSLQWLPSWTLCWGCLYVSTSLHWMLAASGFSWELCNFAQCHPGFLCPAEPIRSRSCCFSSTCLAVLTSVALCHCGCCSDGRAPCAMYAGESELSLGESWGRGQPSGEPGRSLCRWSACVAVSAEPDSALPSTSVSFYCSSGTILQVKLDFRGKSRACLCYCCPLSRSNVAHT